MEGKMTKKILEVFRYNKFKERSSNQHPSFLKIDMKKYYFSHLSILEKQIKDLEKKALSLEMLLIRITISQRSKMTNNRIITLENKDISVLIDTFFV